MSVSPIHGAQTVFNDFASSYVAKYMDVAAYAESIHVFTSLLPNTSAHVLELGCGPGNLTKAMCEQLSILEQNHLQIQQSWRSPAVNQTDTFDLVVVGKRIAN